MKIENLGAILESHYNARNKDSELSLKKPDPLFVVKEHISNAHIDEIAVICALLAYGNAGQILRTLQSIDFHILGNKNAIIRAKVPYYRFQSSDDIKNMLLAMSEIITLGGIKRIFVQAYKCAKIAESALDSTKITLDSAKNIERFPILCGINAMIDAITSIIISQNLAQNSKHSHLTKQSQNLHNLSKGLRFLIGQKVRNINTSSPLKRWNLFLRWMVRKDNIDLGLWSENVERADLILPLDTHTFRLSKKLGLLERKSYDLRSALEITANLAKFCVDDPIKYDFALYRLGQEKVALDSAISRENTLL